MSTTATTAGPRVDGVSPIGRIVQGGFEGRTTDADDKPLVYKSGPKAGQPRTNYFLALACTKGTEEINTVIRLLHKLAAESFPHLFNDPNANANPLLAATYQYLVQLGLVVPKTKDFSFKIIDGDGVDANGELNANKDGFAGCWVLRFSSSSPFKGYWYPDHMTMPLEDPGARILRGFFARVTFNASKNDGQTPGVYVNPEHVIGVGYGKVIQGGRDIATAVKGIDMMAGMGNVAGMSTTPMDGYSPPVAGSSPAAPPPGSPAHTTTMPGAPAPAPVVAAPAPVVAAPAPAPVVPVVAAPAPPPAPDPAFVHNAGVPAGPVYVMTALANGLTREAYHASQWTDEQLLTNGYMTIQQ